MIVDVVCKCGHPSINHCASGHYDRNTGILTATAGMGSCLVCEDNFLEARERGETLPEPCDGFIGDHPLDDQSKEYQRFKYLYEEDE